MERVLDPFASSPKPAAAGTAQLVLAGALTVTSWVGYHSSWNRPQWFIRFPNLPLLQFLTDVLLVVDYWFLATSFPLSDKDASPLAAVICVSIAFVLYGIWDATSYWMRKDDRYVDRPLKYDVPKRRRVTYVFLAASLMLLSWVSAGHPAGGPVCVTICVLLTVLVLGYRFAKDFFFAADEPRRVSTGA